MQAEFREVDGLQEQDLDVLARPPHLQYAVLLARPPHSQCAVQCAVLRRRGSGFLGSTRPACIQGF